VSHPFRLLSEDGEDLGPFVSSEPKWHTGHQIHRGPDDTLEVVRLVPAEEDDDVNGYLVIRRAT
jgi:hypothetical protein